MEVPQHRLGPWEKRSVCRSTLERIGETATEAEVNEELRRLGQTPLGYNTFRKNYKLVFGRPPDEAQCLLTERKDRADAGKEPDTMTNGTPAARPTRETLRVPTEPAPGQDPLAVAGIRGPIGPDRLEEFLKFAAVVLLVGGPAKARHYLDVLERLEHGGPLP